MELIQCIIVEDELLLRDELIYLLKDFEGLNVLNTFTNGIESLDYLKSNKVHLVFMDINIPGMNGIQLAEHLKDIGFEGLIVFITSYENYAIKAFDLDAVDYILKPFEKRRIAKAINKVYKFYANKEKDENRIENEIGSKVEQLIEYMEKDKNKLKKFPCELCGRTIFLNTEDIYLCFTLNEVTYVKTKDKEYMTTFTLSEIEAKTDFFRVHRSYIINIKYVKELFALFNYNFKIVMEDEDNTEIPVSRNKVKDLKKQLGMK